MDSMGLFELGDLIPVGVVHPRGSQGLAHGPKSRGPAGCARRSVDCRACAGTRRGRDLLAIRRQVLVGTYMTDDKLEIVVARLVEVFADGPRRTAAGA